MPDNAPHDWLFKHVSCVVHHGGAGTTAAGIAAGRPTVIVPFFGDQAFWGAVIERARAGPNPIPQKQLTAQRLAEAISFCLRTTTLERAQELARRTAAERGGDTGAQVFHQHLSPDKLRCTLAPSRPAAWRIKSSQVKLSAFAVCTLIHANLLDLGDLKLFRAQEYDTDEGPWDPISGGFVAACGAFGGMAMGLADLPSDTWRAIQLPSRDSRQRSQARVPTAASERRRSKSGQEVDPFTVSDRSQTSLESTPASGTPQSSSDNRLEETSPSQVHSRSDLGSGKKYHPMVHESIHTHKPFSRLAKALIQSPMELSLSFTKCFHNLPKAWGDDTVRSQPEVGDFMSVAKTAGKEFGLGMYDGITDLVTQPWKAARKEGLSGFAKGCGKGMGGFVAKPSAAMFGVLGYTMKGVQKEVQKHSGDDVQSYIAELRAAQGHEEWLMSSDAEKQDVIAGWKVLQKYLSRKHSPDEMLRDVLAGQRKVNQHARTDDRDSGNCDQPIDGNDATLIVDGEEGQSVRSLEAAYEVDTMARSPKNRRSSKCGFGQEPDLRLENVEDEVFGLAESGFEKQE